MLDDDARLIEIPIVLHTKLRQWVLDDETVVPDAPFQNHVGDAPAKRLDVRLGFTGDQSPSHSRVKQRLVDRFGHDPLSLRSNQ